MLLSLWLLQGMKRDYIAHRLYDRTLDLRTHIYPSPTGSILYSEATEMTSLPFATRLCPHKHVNGYLKFKRETYVGCFNCIKTLSSRNR